MLPVQPQQMIKSFIITAQQPRPLRRCRSGVASHALQVRLPVKYLSCFCFCISPLLPSGSPNLTLLHPLRSFL